MSFAGDLVAISKPRIITLLLVVAWAAMFVASGGLPDPVAFLAVTVAGVASTASSGAMNHVIEKDRDARMGRTADRPIASGRISRTTGAVYALVMAVISVVALALPGLYLAAALTAGAILFYLVVYTVLLKPNTAQNIVIGGFAGSFPALIGWAAATGGLAWPAWILAGIVFFWTPPHFWALALLYKEDYAAADYPMMPAVKGEASTKRQMVFYAAVTVAVSLALVPLGSAGYLYLIAAAVLGALFVGRCAQLLGDVPRTQYRSYFLFTIQYLGVLLLILMGDQLIVSNWPAAKPF